MAKMIQIPYEIEVAIPIETAQAVQGNREQSISLQALGLLVNLLSYPATWELHKTELYKRFGKDGRTAVKSAWDDLANANYIIEFRYRNGKKYEYVYYFRKVPFTDEEKAKILDNAEKEYGQIWGVDSVHLKMETSKPVGNQNNKLNKLPKINKDINTDDDKRTSSPLTEKEEYIISHLREETKDELSDRSFKSVVRKVVDKYKQGKVEKFRDYLVTALINKIEELEIRRMKDQANAELVKQKAVRKRKELEKVDTTREVVFYNWLE